MPKKELLSIGRGNGGIVTNEAAANLHFSVGQNGDNGMADVMLIQTMFRFLASTRKKNHLNLLGFTLNELPGIDGICGNRTKRAILKFQIKHRNKLLRADGLIHPANYASRLLTPDRNNKYMTITWLHFLSVQEGLFLNVSSYIEGLIKMEPRLAPWLV